MIMFVSVVAVCNTNTHSLQRWRHSITAKCSVHNFTLAELQHDTVKIVVWKIHAKEAPPLARVYNQNFRTNATELKS